MILAVKDQLNKKAKTTKFVEIQKKRANIPIPWQLVINKIGKG